MPTNASPEAGKQNETSVETSGSLIVSQPKKLEGLLFKALKKELKESVTIRIGHGMTKGFRIGVKGEDVYYDISDESIAALLKSFLNPGLNAIVDPQAGKKKDG